MNRRSEIVAFQMVHNRGYEDAITSVKISIEMQKELMEVFISDNHIKCLNYLNDLQHEIKKLKPRKNKKNGRV
jgi:ribonuclease BN (tRNA processing enzyme)